MKHRYLFVVDKDLFERFKTYATLKQSTVRQELEKYMKKCLNKNENL